MREQLVEIHRAHHRANVGHDQIEQRLLEVGDFIGGAPGVDHRIERDAVDLHRRIVLGDDLLARNVDHLLHHVELTPDRVDIGQDQAEPGRQRPDHQHRRRQLGERVDAHPGREDAREDDEPDQP